MHLSGRTKAATRAPHNDLLAALPSKHLRTFLDQCERSVLLKAQVLCQPGERIRHVYFPIDSFISLVTMADDGSQLEVGLIGHEGMLGTSLLLGVNIAPLHAVVQGPGLCLRMTAVAFERQCGQSSTLRERINQYVAVVMKQLAQTAACTRHHIIETRLAHRLLQTRDRVRSNRFSVTHELLANALGVRRVGITQAAGALQSRGLIDYRRGKVLVLDGAGLEQAACPCYTSGNEMYDSMLGIPDRSLT